MLNFILFLALVFSMTLTFSAIPLVAKRVWRLIRNAYYNWEVRRNFPEQWAENREYIRTRGGQK